MGARRVILGRIVGLFGVRGWVKVHSHTRPPESILTYSPWDIGKDGDWQARTLVEGRAHGRGIVARLEGCSDRDQAAALVGQDIAVSASRLPQAKPGEYYWAQLEGLKVVNLAGRTLGAVSHLLETGANDVLVVIGGRERLIPFTPDVVKKVDLALGVVHVDWDEDF